MIDELIRLLKEKNTKCDKKSEVSQALEGPKIEASQALEGQLILVKKKISSSLITSCSCHFKVIWGI